MKGSRIPRIELSTVHLYRHYSLFVHNKLQYTWRGDYCECVRPAQLPVLTENRAPSLLEQYPRYVPHRDSAGYNKVTHRRTRTHTHTHTRRHITCKTSEYRIKNKGTMRYLAVVSQKIECIQRLNLLVGRNFLVQTEKSEQIMTTI